MHRAELDGDGGCAGRPRRANPGCVFVGPKEGDRCELQPA